MALRVLVACEESQRVCTAFRERGFEAYSADIQEPSGGYPEWHERTKKRDADNIISSTKFILDALQKQGILINDNRRYVRQIYSKIIDDEADFVEVTLREVK